MAAVPTPEPRRVRARGQGPGGLDIDATAFLPADTISGGFDNVADVQTFSPALMQGYLRAAGRIAALAVGDPASSPSQATFKLPKTASQLERAEGAPFGTRGGISVEHTFPADGDYVFSMDFFAEPLGLLFGSPSANEKIEVSIDGARVALFDIDPRMSEEKTGLTIKSAPARVTAGSHRVTAAFLQRAEGLVNDLIAPIDHTLADTEIGIAFGITTLPHLRSLSIIGPHRVTGVSDTPSRRQVFTCRPTVGERRNAVRRTIIRQLAGRAFRRPVTDRDVDASADVLHARARGTRLRIRHDARRSKRFSRARNFSFGSKRNPRTRQAVRIVSATTSSRAVSPSSCGAAGQTRNCCASPARDGWRRRRH